MNFSKWNNLFGWVVFAIATTVYALTLEPTVSFWDCGEWIAVSHKFEVGHPPGAPVYQLFAHLFSWLALGNAARIAWAINLLSAVASGATVMFLFWTISRLISRFRKEHNINTFTTIPAAFAGAMIFCFSDSFWFSAVEAEVYALSSLFTAVILWLMLRWADDYSSGESRSARWPLLAVFLLSVSEGVHFLSLLVIPSAVMVIYYTTFKPKWWKLPIAFFVAFAALLTVFKVIIPGVFLIFAKCNLLFVNTLHLSTNAGMILTAIILAVVLISVLVVALLKRKRCMELAAVGCMLFLTGLSPNILPILRAQAGTPINEGCPDNPVSFYSYWKRDQYPQPPLIYGPYFSTPVEGYKTKKPSLALAYSVETQDTTILFPSKFEANTFISENGIKATRPRPIYIVADSGRNCGYRYNDDFCTFFPRMWKADAYQSYLVWGGQHGQIIEHDGDYTYKPSFADNIRFFVTFQLGHSYLRYFMWNFCGKFNDSQGYGSIRNGACTTGIPFIDSYFNGTAKSEIPESLRNEGRNEYYAIPLILGILGLFFHYKRDSRGATVVALLFLTTSVGLVFYLNSAPYEPRERDYVYVTSFYAFAIWTGMGTAMLISLMGKIRGKAGQALQIPMALIVMAIPTLMAAQNYNDHNRSNRQTARDAAYNILQSCQKNAILFCHGDNDTFPLWYLQEVEGVRTDVRIVNLSLLNMSWYIDQCQRKVYDNAPLQISFGKSQYQGRKRQLVFTDTKGKKILSISDVIDIIKDDEKAITYMDGVEYFVIPSARVEIPVNKEAFAEQTPGIKYKKIPKNIYVLLNHTMNRSDIMHYDILMHNDWRRPVYYTRYALSAIPELKGHLQIEGMAYRLTPFEMDNSKRINSEQIAVNHQLMYENILHGFSWNDLHGVYLDETSRSFADMLLENITQLSETLVEKRLSTEATILWDTVHKYYPDKLLKDEVILAMLNAYWAAGDTAINAFAQHKTDQLATETGYFFTMSPQVRHYVEADIEQCSETMLHMAMLAKKHKQEIPFNLIFDRLNPFLEPLTAIWDSKLRFYFSSDDPLHYEEEIGSYIDKLQTLYDLMEGRQNSEHLAKVSQMLKYHVENYTNL